MPISGIVIRIDPVQRAGVVSRLESLAGLELQPSPPGDRLVAVLDTADFQAEEKLVKTISDTDGVSNVAVAYHNFEDMSSDL